MFDFNRVETDQQVQAVASTARKSVQGLATSSVRPGTDFVVSARVTGDHFTSREIFAELREHWSGRAFLHDPRKLLTDGKAGQRLNPR